MVEAQSPPGGSIPWSPVRQTIVNVSGLVTVLGTGALLYYHHLRSHLCAGVCLRQKRIAWVGVLGGLGAILAASHERINITLGAHSPSYPTYEVWYSQFESRRLRPSNTSVDYPPGNPLLVDERGDPIVHNSQQWLEAVAHQAQPMNQLRRWVFHTTLQALSRGYRVEDEIVLPQSNWNPANEPPGVLVYQSEVGATPQVDVRPHPTPDISPVLKLGIRKIPNQFVVLQTSFEVVQGDCVEAASQMLEELEQIRGPHSKVALLNMMNAAKRGGAPAAAAGAQEENLCRRSNLYYHLDACPDYPLPPSFVMYSSDVVFIRGSEDKGYPFLKPVLLDVVGVAAPVIPVQSGQDKEAIYRAYEQATRDHEEKIKENFRLTLRACYENGVQNIVLSALGCGAFRNHPRVVAESLRSVFEEEEFRGVFARVRIAIIEDHNSQGKPHCLEGNYEPFRSVFQDLVNSSAI